MLLPSQSSLLLSGMNDGFRVGFMDVMYPGLDSQVQHCALEGHSAREYPEALSASRLRKYPTKATPKGGVIPSTQQIFLSDFEFKSPILSAVTKVPRASSQQKHGQVRHEKTHGICEAALRQNGRHH